MQLLILGATGPTGQQLVRLALEKFHHVTVLVRDPAKLNLRYENLTIIIGMYWMKIPYQIHLKERMPFLAHLVRVNHLNHPT